MTPLSIAADRALTPSSTDMLRVLQSGLKPVAADYFMVGAMAREILLHHVFGCRPGRRTTDIDFAIATASWDKFNDIKRYLCDVGFKTDDRQVQRLIYVDEVGIQTAVDVLPFGGVQSSDGNISWPPDFDMVMSVCGYEDVNRSTVLVKVADQLEIRVASIPGLTVLKLVAWVNRGAIDNKDAKDLRTIIDGYETVVTAEPLYDIDGLMDELDYQVDLGIARLLGVHAFRVASEETRTALFVELEVEGKQNKLANNMAKDGSDLEKSEALLQQLLLGLKQGR